MRCTRHLCLLAIACLATAAEQHGTVTFNALPVPGATVIAIQEKQTLTTITDSQGVYTFPDLGPGTWTLEVRMLGFETMRQQTPAANFELKLLPLDQINAQIQTTPPPTPPPAKPEPADPDLKEKATDGLLINGSNNNGAASPFAQFAAFGNNRFGQKNLYNGSLGLTFDNSSFDARPFSLTGQDTSKAPYNRLTGMATLGGPIKIRRFFQIPPVFFVSYQWTRNRNSTIVPGLMPTVAQRSGPISPQAQALLNLYPLPNFAGNSGYNYQVPLLSQTHQDALQSRLSKTINPKNQVFGKFAFQSTRSANPNLFGFLDTTDVLGLDASADWSRRLSQRWFLHTGIQFSRLASRVTPYFENRQNISGQSGISGNAQDPMNWGPPALTFSSGIATLTDANASRNRNQTTGLSGSMYWNRNSHNISFGGDFRRQEFNYLSQQNPRGSFTFTGAATGNDFADFLAGIPDTASLAYGNADKYFRESVYDAYITDDWRVSPELTVNAGMRWEYGAPITEIYNRLVNLNLSPDFTSAVPVFGTVHPDRRAFEPRIGIAWRPLSGSSLVVRAGYGVYYNTSVYQTIALQMAQQPPLSKSYSVQNTASDPLTLANGFNATPPAIANTFAIDPNFRIGNAQNWNLSVQRDLPASLQITASYLGIKGTRGTQDFLPNTYPAGAVNPCPACPTGFAYLTSNGNSTRESANIQLRRRMHNGLTATVDYTFSKSIDDDATLGGSGSTPPSLQIAQNWLDLRAERSLSSFDQRHLLNLQGQYTTGMGMGGGTLLNGWRGALLKEWTVASQITAGTGLPETPIYLAPVQGTGITGTIRPSYDGKGYTAPLPGQWGNAGRDTIIGPSQFSLNASLGRTFRVSDRLNLDLRVDAANALNHVTYTTWNTTVNSTQFGLPAAANAMRSLQTTLRLRF